MLVLANPLRSLRVAHAGCDGPYRLVVQHVRLPRLLDRPQPLEHSRGDLDRVLEPLRYRSPPPYLPLMIIALLHQRWKREAAVVGNDGHTGAGSDTCSDGGLRRRWSCISTRGNDTITGSEEQDEIYSLEGDDTIDWGTTP